MLQLITSLHGDDVISLAEAIITEMSEDLSGATRMYTNLADDDRLRHRERAEARLWVGTSTTKANDLTTALAAIDEASRLFEEHDNPDEWAIAQQKRALALLAAGDCRFRLKNDPLVSG